MSNWALKKNMYNTILLSTGILRLSLMFCFLILNVSTKKKMLITMWIWLPCSYYSAWHDRWLVKHFPKALCRKISCLSRKTWMSIWGGCFFFSSCRHPLVTFELRGGNCIASSCLFFVEAPIPHTHCRLSKHLMPSPFILLFYFYFFFKFLVAAHIDSQS